MSDFDPPNGYTISGEGSGGAAGFAKGGAKVALEADGEATILTYTVDAQIGGKLDQLGVASGQGTDLAANATDIEGVKVVATTVDGAVRGFLECLTALERGEWPRWVIDRTKGY